MGWESLPTHILHTVEIQLPAYDLEPATLRDMQAIYEMDRVCFPLDAWPLIEIIAALTFPRLVRIKAVIDDKPVGFVGGDARPSKGFGWITTIAVLPPFRRMGIANALLDACEMDMGMPFVKLAVRKSNFEAQALYLKCGYKQVELWEHYYDGGEDALILVKKIFANP